MQQSIQSLVQDFVSRLTDMVESEAESRARDAVLSALGGQRNGRSAVVHSARGAKGPRRLSAAGLKARKIQGQYLGSLRALKGEARARVQKMAREKSVAEAVKLAHALKAKQA